MCDHRVDLYIQRFIQNYTKKLVSHAADDTQHIVASTKESLIQSLPKKEKNGRLELNFEANGQSTSMEKHRRKCMISASTRGYPQ